MLTSRSRRVRGWLLLLLGASLVLPALLYAHIRLETSSPARDEVVSVAPQQLRLLFSARIEGRYTTLALTAPDGSRVSPGPVVFVAGSDREITVQLPPLRLPGVYTVAWRTAGADGHVLEGSYPFTLALDSARTAPPQDRAPAPAPADEHAHHEEPRAVEGAGDAFGRGLHFLALLLVLGAVAFRVLLLPRLAVTPGTQSLLTRRAWRALAAAALLLAAAAVLRLWFQSAALHGAERAWSSPLLSIMLTDTGWGRAWLLQALLFALLGIAIVWARPGRDRAAMILAVPAVAGLAAIPGMSGHAAGAARFAHFAVVNDALHVAAVGTWLGTLAILMIAALPVIRRREPEPGIAAADAIDAFSPIALAGAVTVILTGVINTLMHLSSPLQLWTTEYGQTLLWKIVLVAGVIAMGFVNWQVVRPRLRRDGLHRLRYSAVTELLLALLVLAATAVLTGRPRP